MWSFLKTSLTVFGIVCAAAILPAAGLVVGSTVAANAVTGGLIGVCIGGVLSAGTSLWAYRYMYAADDEAQIRDLRAQIRDALQLHVEVRESGERIIELRRQLDVVNERSREIERLRQVEHAERQRVEQERARLEEDLANERLNRGGLLRQFSLIRATVVGIQDRVAANDIPRDELSDELDAVGRRLRVD